MRKDQPLPQLGGHVAALDKMLADNVKTPKGARLTFQRMYDELRLAGYPGVMTPCVATALKSIFSSLQTRLDEECRTARLHQSL